MAFIACRVFLIGPGGTEEHCAPPAVVLDWAAGEGGRVAERVAANLASLTGPRVPFAGLAHGRPAVVGIINATPDSFSDGGALPTPEAAAARAFALVEAGADMLDIGGESTRPGAEPVSAEEELDRVIPVIERLGGIGVPISIDTRRASVMRAAVAAGATVVNDVGALGDDPDAVDAVRETGAWAVLMHKRGAPATMHLDPVYDHVSLDVLRYLRGRVAACRVAGIPAERLAVDPGIGFGKTAAHNRHLLADIGLLHGIGRPVMLGASRKFGRGRPGTDRLGPSLAAVTLAAAQGVQLFRVHDVAETRAALDLVHLTLTGAHNGAGPASPSDSPRDRPYTS